MPGLNTVNLRIHDHYFVADNFLLLHFYDTFFNASLFFPFVRFKLQHPVISSRETLRYTNSIYHIRHFFLHAA